MSSQPATTSFEGTAHFLSNSPNVNIKINIDISTNQTDPPFHAWQTPHNNSPAPSDSISHQEQLAPMNQESASWHPSRGSGSWPAKVDDAERNVTEFDGSQEDASLWDLREGGHAVSLASVASKEQDDATIHEAEKSEREREHNRNHEQLGDEEVDLTSPKPPNANVEHGRPTRGRETEQAARLTVQTARINAIERDMQLLQCDMRAMGLNLGAIESQQVRRCISPPRRTQMRESAGNVASRPVPARPNAVRPKAPESDVSGWWRDV